MGLISTHAAEKLGFPEIVFKLSSQSRTEDGRQICLEVEPLNSIAEIQADFRLSVEALKLFRAEEYFPIDFSPSVSRIIAEASIAGNWLSPDDLLKLLRWLEMARQVWTWFKTRKEQVPALWEIVAPLRAPDPLISEISSILDEKGNIKDRASAELSKIRSQINDYSTRLRRELNRILRHAISQGWTSEKEITFRNDRLVIPLNADFKGRIQGFVHDASQSGQTLYIEPQEGLEMNNILRKLASDEKKEIVKILLEVTAKIREQAKLLSAVRGVITHLDFLNAKASLAVILNACYPVTKPDEKDLLILKGRHPQLLLRTGSEKKKVVSNTVELSSEKRILLISGPNAGGKTVSLKLTGLLCLMYQSGLPVPCEDQSRFPWFNRIFVSIGDEQSIQSDLSTYTSHLAQLNEMLSGMDEKTLFMVDEFGAGTDPRMGGAIAEAFLEQFLQKRGYGLISTHYGNLKDFAERHTGIQNAAMQFDPLNLQPTYILEMGYPGGSYAFEIARNVGVAEHILQRASSKMDQGQLKYEDLLVKLDAQKGELEQVLAENKAKNAELKTLLERNWALKKEMDQNKIRILREARDKAQSLLKEANRKIENTIREIREAQADKEITKKLRADLAVSLPKEVQEQLKAEEPDLNFEEELPEQIIEKLGERPEPGDWVRFRDNEENMGQVIEIQSNRATVRVGDLRVTAKLGNLVKIVRSKGETPVTETIVTIPHSQRISVQRKASIQHELNVMGLRVEQALSVVERFIDDACLGGIKQVRILHGKGSGALRSAIRNYLNTLHRVNSIQDASVESGGSGWTVVGLE